MKERTLWRGLAHCIHFVDWFMSITQGQGSLVLLDTKKNIASVEKKKHTWRIDAKAQTKKQDMSQLVKQELHRHLPVEQLVFLIEKYLRMGPWNNHSKTTRLCPGTLGITTTNNQGKNGKIAVLKETASHHEIHLIDPEDDIPYSEIIFRHPQPLFLLESSPFPFLVVGCRQSNLFYHVYAGWIDTKTCHFNGFLSCTQWNPIASAWHTRTRQWFVLLTEQSKVATCVSRGEITSVLSFKRPDMYLNFSDIAVCEEKIVLMDISNNSLYVFSLKAEPLACVPVSSVPMSLCGFCDYFFVAVSQNLFCFDSHLSLVQTWPEAPLERYRLAVSLNGSICFIGKEILTVFF